jgi:nitroreductase
MMRFLRALVQALRLTLKGETLTPPRYRPLESWIARGLNLVERVEGSAAAQRLDLAALQLKLDGRPISLERTLQMLRHNLVNEYPRLMRLDDAYSMMVVSASNMNDQYRVAQFLEAGEIPAETRAALAALDAHLQALPQPPPEEKDIV